MLIYLHAYILIDAQVLGHAVFSSGIRKPWREVTNVQQNFYSCMMRIIDCGVPMPICRVCYIAYFVFVVGYRCLRHGSVPTKGLVQPDDRNAEVVLHQCQIGYSSAITSNPKHVGESCPVVNGEIHYYGGGWDINLWDIIRLDRRISTGNQAYQGRCY